jgi:hypothetical protein
MQPADRRTEFSLPGVASVLLTPTICLFLFTLNLVDAVPGGASVFTPWVVLMSALLSSIAGSAFSHIVALLFHAMNEPLAVILTLLVASVAQQIYCVWRLRETIPLHECFPYLIASVATLPIGLSYHSTLLRIPVN